MTINTACVRILSWTYWSYNTMAILFWCCPGICPIDCVRFKMEDFLDRFFFFLPPYITSHFRSHRQTYGKTWGNHAARHLVVAFLKLRGLAVLFVCLLKWVTCNIKDESCVLSQGLDHSQWRWPGWTCAPSTIETTLKTNSPLGQSTCKVKQMLRLSLESCPQKADRL